MLFNRKMPRDTRRMQTSAGRPYRRSVRLPFDYRGVTCFVTVCSHLDRCTFGRIVGQDMILSAIGRIIDEEWSNTSVIRPDVVLDEYQIMPNHIHLIVYIPEAPTVIARIAGHLVRPPRSLSSLIGQFKAGVTRRVRELFRNPRYHVWQRGFHDKVVRNGEALEGIQAYIRNNPAEWSTDPHNPAVRS